MDLKKHEVPFIRATKELFKDEVRKLGKELNITDDFVNRHPFPRPGLGIRILGEINQKNVKLLMRPTIFF